jgi:hypothetical protein
MRCIHDSMTVAGRNCVLPNISMEKGLLEDVEVTRPYSSITWPTRIELLRLCSRILRIAKPKEIAE